MQKKYLKRIKASTLVETLVALVITMTVFFMALSAILQSQRSDNARERLKASAVLEKYMNKDQAFLSQTDSIKDGKLTIVVQTIANDTIPDLYLLQLTAYSEQKIPLAEKRIIRKRNLTEANQK